MISTTINGSRVSRKCVYGGRRGRATGSGLLRGEEPDDLNKAIADFIHRDALDWGLNNASYALVIDDLVPKDDPIHKFRMQIWPIEALRSIELI